MDAIMRDQSTHRLEEARDDLRTEPESISETEHDKHVVTLLLSIVDALLIILECQYKTSVRVKTMEENQRRWRDRFDGAKWTIGVLCSLGGLIGGAGLMKLLEFLSKAL